ncbi:MAG: hypothetical protein E6J34_15635 [Chloroflexi bacterium]|nr:MAG: hypothetical protein E6J34_15635 [Chloroflexota bacterium]
MLQPPSFFMNIDKAGHEKRLTAGLKLFVQEFSRIKDTLEALHFIYGNGSHWWLCTLSFASEEFQIRDGLTLSPPPFRDSFEFVFKKFLDIDLKSWKIVRSECPQQNDSNNCGIIALGAMEQLCSRGIVEIWSQKNSSKFRMMWLRRMVEKHIHATKVLAEIERASLYERSQVWCNFN